jgi:pimeloyl-ACP methyl ester carboxylesterase
MGKVTVGRENSTDVELYYEDQGSGKPVVLIHGFPLSGASWERQAAALLAAGHRVITYDRRGFGKSSKPSSGYDYDTFAADLRALITSLELRDVALVGFSMGGGEVARYVGKYGTEGVRKVGILSGVTPYLLKAPDNAEGVDLSVFTGIEDAIKADRFGFLDGFFQNFYNADVEQGKTISKHAMHASWNVAAEASAIATLASVKTWYTDFRADVAKIDVPALVMHGDADRIVPIAASGARTGTMIEGAKYVVVKGAPHGMLWTHAEQVNAALVPFLS